jgi:hypothetical protein
LINLIQSTGLLFFLSFCTRFVCQIAMSFSLHSTSFNSSIPTEMKISEDLHDQENVTCTSAVVTSDLRYRDGVLHLVHGTRT